MQLVCWIFIFLFSNSHEHLEKDVCREITTNDLSTSVCTLTMLLLIYTVHAIINGVNYASIAIYLLLV